MSLPRYPSYKSSGVAWLGDVPEHWDAVRLRQLGRLLKGSGGSKEDITEDGVPCVRYGDLYTTHRDFITRARTRVSAERASGYTTIRRGDILFAGSGETFEEIGKSAVNLIDGDAVCGGDLIILRPSTPVDARLLAYACDSSNAAAQKAVMGRGTTVKHIYPDELRLLALCLPPVGEQSAIAIFLDRETAKIDALVAEQERLIELLKEKRQAVISHAVTKGVHPHATMKASGIEWLGDVPEHWEMKRLGWICEVNDINHEMPEAVGDGVLFLSAKDLLDDGTLNFETDVKMISEEDYERLSQKIRPRRGDIIYSRIGAALGKARLVETDAKFNVSYSCCVVRVMDEVAYPPFIRVLLDGEMILTEARMRTKGIGVPDLGLGEISRFPVPLPPLTEQRAIVDVLEHETRLMTALTAEAERAIDLLQERRAALVTAAVTGQVDVRALAPLLSEASSVSPPRVP